MCLFADDLTKINFYLGMTKWNFTLNLMVIFLSALKECTHFGLSLDDDNLVITQK